MLEVQFDRRAAKQLATLPVELRRRIGQSIESLQTDPRPPGFKVLKGKWKGKLRIRVGQYRVAYEVDDAAGILGVVKVGRREGFYDDL